MLVSTYPELNTEVSAWLRVNALNIVVFVLLGKPTMPICISLSLTSWS